MNISLILASVIVIILMLMAIGNGHKKDVTVITLGMAAFAIIMSVLIANEIRKDLLFNTFGVTRILSHNYECTKYKLLTSSDTVIYVEYREVEK